MTKLRLLLQDTCSSLIRTSCSSWATLHGKLLLKHIVLSRNGFDFSPLLFFCHSSSAKSWRACRTSAVCAYQVGGKGCTLKYQEAPLRWSWRVSEWRMQAEWKAGEKVGVRVNILDAVTRSVWPKVCGRHHQGHATMSLLQRPQILCFVRFTFVERAQVE